MSDNHEPRRVSEPTLIRTPDQLQQAKRPATSAPVDVGGRRSEDSTRETGILGQLETERAHD